MARQVQEYESAIILAGYEACWHYDEVMTKLRNAGSDLSIEEVAQYELASQESKTNGSVQ